MFFLGLLGAGTVTSAIVSPASLVIGDTKPKNYSQWQEGDFKRHCYGNFLKEESKGELLIYEDRSEGSKKL